MKSASRARSKFALWAGGVCLLALLVATAFTLKVARGPNADELRIGVFLYDQHQVINEIHAGFRDALEGQARARNLKIHWMVRNAEGNASQSSAIASYFKGEDLDLIFVVGVPAAQALKAANIRRPVVFGGPPDPIKAGLVPRLTGHDTYFTGTSFFPSQEALVAVLRSARPATGKIAILANPGEANSAALVEAFSLTAAQAGLSTHRYAVSNIPELEAALNDITANPPEAVFLPTDNFVYSALERIISKCKASKVETFSVTRQAVERGALFSVGADYHRVGELTAEVAAQIIFDKRRPQDVDVRKVEDGIVFVRKELTVTPPAGYRVMVIND